MKLTKISFFFIVAGVASQQGVALEDQTSPYVQLLRGAVKTKDVAGVFVATDGSSNGGYTYEDIREQELKCKADRNRWWKYDAATNTWSCPLQRYDYSSAYHTPNSADSEDKASKVEDAAAGVVAAGELEEELRADEEKE